MRYLPRGVCSQPPWEENNYQLNARLYRLPKFHSTRHRRDFKAFGRLASLKYVACIVVCIFAKSPPLFSSGLCGLFISFYLVFLNGLFCSMPLFCTNSNHSIPMFLRTSLHWCLHYLICLNLHLSLPFCFPNWFYCLSYTSCLYLQT